MSFDMDQLEYIIYGARTPDEPESILATTPGITADVAQLVNSLVTLDPLPADTQAKTQAVGMFNGSDGQFILGIGIYQDADPQQPLFYYVLLPPDVLQLVAGNITALLEIIGEGITIPAEDTPLEPLRMPPTPTWTSDKRMVLFSKLINDYNDGDVDRVFKLLAALLDERSLLIRGFSADVQDRLHFVQGLMMLLPSPARTEVTFATNVTTVANAQGMIVFSDDDAETERLTDESLNNLELPPYVGRLAALWDGNLQTFVGQLRTMELIAVHLMNDKSLMEGLGAVAERLRLDAIVTLGEDIPADVLKSVFTNALPQVGPLLEQYTLQLLRLAVEERDPEAVSILNAAMQRDENVNDLVNSEMERLLGDEPDAVYFFIRTILTDGFDERWLSLLHASATVSMSIVLQQQGDAETVMTWLKLIANEPATYQLNVTLRDGIRAAKELAHTDGELGRRLLSFTARRVPDLLMLLLQDEVLLTHMEAPVGLALRDYEAQAVEDTVDTGHELALIVLSRALVDAPEDAPAAAVFTPENIDFVWQLYASDQSFDDLPDAMQPSVILEGVIDGGQAWLAVDAMETLLKQALVAGDSAMMLRICTHLIPPANLFELVVDSMQASAISSESIVMMTRTLIDNDVMTPQQVVDVYLRVAGARGWDSEATLALVEQIGRMFQQNATLNAPFDALQHMIDLASSAQIEPTARAIMRRMLGHIEALEDEAQQIAQMRKLYQNLAWTTTTRNQMVGWWRNFARTQPLTRLQQLAKRLEAVKALDWAHNIAQTAIAVRKMMGKRTLEDFADGVSVAYSILQSLADSFDAGRRNLDQATFRAELNARDAELTPDERSVLAKNLRELADLITDMADRRSKATLIRREEEIERQLLAGSQEPQSAIDTMRWLSGYLSGMQDGRD